MRRLIVVALVLASLGGCAVKRDWFGNEPPSPTPVRSVSSAACATHQAEAPVRGVPVPVPGRNAMYITTHVRAWSYKRLPDGKYGTDLDREWCVPFLFTMDVHVIGPGVAENPISMVDRGTGRPMRMPSRGSGKTPWVTDGLVLWDLDQYPPAIRVHLEATYDAQRDFTESGYGGPVAFRCSISVNGGAAPVVVDVKPDAHAAGFVRCDLDHEAIPLLA